MDEETAIIDKNTRNEKIRNFFINNKKSLFLAFIIIVLIMIAYFIFAEFRENKKIKISDKYNSIVTEYTDDNKKKTQNSLLELI